MKTLIVVSVFIFCSSAKDFIFHHKILTIPTNTNISSQEIENNRRITNRNNATDGQFPFSARLSLIINSGGIFGCSGSIISTNFILGAGHCIDNIHENVTSVLIEVGTANVDIQTTKVYAQEQWWLDATDLAALDLAIYRLFEHLTFNTLINSIQLPKLSQRYDEFVGNPSLNIGWGRGRTGSSTKILQYGKYRILSNYVCGKQFQTFYEICSIPDDWHPKLSTQGGDSGSPLIIHEDGIPTQIGIHVRRRVTGGQKFHVATRLSLFLEFINEITGIPIRD